MYYELKRIEHKYMFRDHFYASLHHKNSNIVQDMQEYK
jgi:hypothetical protein